MSEIEKRNHNFKDLTGGKFGKLIVLKYDRSNKRGKALFKCQCECGNIKVIIGTSLSFGRTQSCGCLREGQTKKLNELNYKHGMNGKPIYNVHRAMLNRCNLETDYHYPGYGGRGISVCKEWMKFEPFYKWAVANGYSEGLTIDRVNNNGNYEPSNCRWTTYKEQARNSRNNRIIDIDGESLCVAEWGEKLGIKPQIISKRLFRGWPERRAVLTPVKR
ncbi:MAG TPA: hypothetical protein VMW95_09200 [Desulfobacterales bacterium]|nr:hypothetical protein [Desulfobacterales bacterium]